MSVKNRESLRFLSLAVAGTCVLSACGYSLAGRGSYLPAHIDTIGVPMFTNLSDQPGVAELFTVTVVHELTSRGKYKITSDETGVDALLSGTIQSFTISPVTFLADEDPQSESQASRYSVVIRANVEFTDLVSGETIWSDDRFSFREQYDVGEDPETFFDQEGLALTRMAEEFAQTLVSRLLEAF